jgi:hypothetical protein
MRGLEIQLKARSRICETKSGKALTFQFAFGPIRIFIIANMPELNGNGEGPLVYIKVNLKTDEGWQVYSKEQPQSRDD